MWRGLSEAEAEAQRATYLQAVRDNQFTAQQKILVIYLVFSSLFLLHTSGGSALGSHTQVWIAHSPIVCSHRLVAPYATPLTPSTITPLTAIPASLYLEQYQEQ
jgi:hypothetical protein